MKSSSKSAVVKALYGSVNDALRRIDGAGLLSDRQAHETRKQLKRARAALRLLRPTLGDTKYRRENRALRDVSRVVSPLRDARAQLDIVAALRDRYPRELSCEELAPLETSLLDRLTQIRSRIDRRAPAMRKATRTLRISRQRLRAAIKQGVSAKDVGRGLRKVFAQSRSAYRTAKSHATPVTLHEWRKKTKYLYNALDLLETPKGTKPWNVEDKARRLGDWLGEEHDLVVLSLWVKQRANGVAPSVERSLKSAINDRRKKLKMKALRRGAKVYDHRSDLAIR
jgi:CHAD domain-containing protein